MDSISRQIQACHVGAGRYPYLHPPMTMAAAMAAAMAATFNLLILLRVCQDHLRRSKRAANAGQITRRRRDDSADKSPLSCSHGKSSPPISRDKAWRWIRQVLRFKMNCLMIGGSPPRTRRQRRLFNVVAHLYAACCPFQYLPGNSSLPG